MTVSQRLAEIATTVTIDDLPMATVKTAGVRLLDGIGVLVAGSRTPVAGVVDRYLSARGIHRVPVPGVPLPKRETDLEMEDTAFVLGCWAFALNYGDTSLLAVTHPSTVVVPALLAAARQTPVSGSEFVCALVVGYQALEYVGQALNNGEPRMGHQLRGFRPTASCGPIGAAAAVARLRGLDRERTATAIELACNYGAGLRRAAGRGGLSANNVHSGEAARSGIRCVLLAEAGLAGNAEMLEGPGGFFSAYRDGTLDEGASRYLAPGPWAIDDIAFKLHCTAHTLHTALDCVLEIQAARRFEPGSIDRIVISVPDEHTAVSGAGVQAPRDGREAGGSYPYAAAVVAATADYAWPDALASHLDDAEVRRLAALVEVRGDAALTRRFHDERGCWPARVEVIAGGSVVAAERALPAGLPSDPATVELVRRKFGRLTRDLLSEAQIGRLLEVAREPVKALDFYADLAAG